LGKKKKLSRRAKKKLRKARSKVASKQEVNPVNLHAKSRNIPISQKTFFILPFLISGSILIILWGVATSELVLNIITGSLALLGLLAQLTPARVLSKKLGFSKISDETIEKFFYSYRYGLIVITIASLSIIYLASFILFYLPPILYGIISLMIPMVFLLIVLPIVNPDLLDIKSRLMIFISFIATIAIFITLLWGFSFITHGHKGKSMFNETIERGRTIHDGMLHNAISIDDYVEMHHAWIQASNDFIDVYMSEMRPRISNPYSIDSWCEFPFTVIASKELLPYLKNKKIEVSQENLTLVGCKELELYLSKQCFIELSPAEFMSKHAIGNNANLLRKLQSRWSLLSKKMDPVLIKDRRNSLKKLWNSDDFRFRASFNALAADFLRPLEKLISRGSAGSRLFHTYLTNQVISKYQPVFHTLLIAILLAISSLVARASIRINERFEQGSTGKYGHYLLSTITVFSFTLFIWALFK
jgi:hypothetical protein